MIGNVAVDTYIRASVCVCVVMEKRMMMNEEEKRRRGDNNDETSTNIYRKTNEVKNILFVLFSILCLTTSTIICSSRSSYCIVYR